MNIDELKDCPFCGHEAEHLHIYDGEEIVRCVNEGCHVRPSVADADPQVAYALWNQRAENRGDEAVPNVRIESYSLPDAGLDIIRAEQRTGPAKWKVSNGGYCLTKTGDWEFEPIPSNRTDDFIARCRFDTDHEAIDAAIKSSNTRRQDD